MQMMTSPRRCREEEESYPVKSLVPEADLSGFTLVHILEIPSCGGIHVEGAVINVALL